MSKTLSEVVAQAHRRLAVLSVDEDPSADMVTYGEEMAQSLLDELIAAPHSMPFTWTLAEVPDAVYRPFAWLLAVDIAPNYQVASESRARAMGRVRAYAFPDDRDDRRDIDEDGIITDAEELAGKQAAFY